jgi:ribosomal protein S18 acetylase RimI-like enzyme
MVEYRPAVAGDSRDIAQLLCIAGGGLYEFLFDDLIPMLTAVDILSFGTAGESYPLSFRNCFVAVDGINSEIVGGANVFPADDLREQHDGIVPLERRQHVQPILELQDWGSMFLNALAVDDRCRGLGVGTRLLDWAKWRAQAAGFDRLSLHVWADNVAAVNFYRARGFVALGVAPVTEHPRLMHTGGSILMQHVIRRPRDG